LPHRARQGFRRSKWVTLCWPRSTRSQARPGRVR